MCDNQLCIHVLEGQARQAEILLVQAAVGVHILVIACKIHMYTVRNYKMGLAWRTHLCQQSVIIC